MKKKIYSILTMFLVALSCVFASACGDKYENMEYQVWYAYSANAQTWHDGTNGISVAYADDYELVEGEEQSSLIFGEGVNQASLYIKVEIKNVKAKHLGSISMSFSSVSGLEFASKMISNGEVVDVPIRKDVKINTTLKLQENNSGKGFSTGFKVSRQLESMEADLGINPAMFSTATLNLSNLTNDVIKYNPSASVTNETGVKYSIGGIGYCTTNGEFHETKDNEAAETYLDLEDGVLSVENSEFITTNANTIKIIATSIYHDGAVESEEAIQTHFYVYVVKTSELSAPNVKFDNAEGQTVAEVHIYENGKLDNNRTDYSESTLFIDGASDFENIKINTISSQISSVKEVVYVKAANGVFKKYNFAGENQQEGINGLSVIGDLENNLYKLKIFDRNIQKNTIKIAYEFEGLDFSYSTNSPVFEKNIVVNKLAVPKVITVNNKDLKNGETESESIYLTSSNEYDGIALKLIANPTTNLQQKIKIIKDGNLIISDSKGHTNFTEVNTGSTIYVKLEGNSSADATLTFATLRTPTYYNGKNVEIKDYEADPNDYITVTYNISKIVTANQLSFVDVNNNYEEFENHESAYIKYDGLDYVYVKAVHSNINLDLSSIKLTSLNPAILFDNGKTEITLEYCSTVGEPSSEGGEYHTIYKVGIQKTNSICEGVITVVAAEGKIGKEDSIKVEAVDYSLKNANVTMSASSRVSGNSNLSNAYIIAKGSIDEFTIELFDEAYNRTRAIKSIELHKDYVNQCVDILEKYSKGFKVLGTSAGNETLTVTVEYFKLSEITNAIVVETKDIEIQIAVINPISSISATATKRTISYVSTRYESAGKTEITFTAKADKGGDILGSVDFLGNDGTKETVSVGTGIIFSVDEYAVYNYLDKGLIYYNSSDISALVESKANFAGKFILEDSKVSKFEKAFTLSLTGDVNIEKIKIYCHALMGGVKTNVSTELVINIEKANRASDIAISGSSLLKLNEKEENKIDDAEIQMSFMTIPDGGSVSTNFNAKILFEGNQGKKHDSLVNDLEFIIYEYELDKDSNFIKDEYNDEKGRWEYKKVLNETAFSVIPNVDNKTITIRANKQSGGGYFKLVIATKDSYKLEYEEQELELEYFDVVKTITVVIADGVKAAYPIYSADDLMYINANLNSKFALYNDIEVEGEYPLGFNTNSNSLQIFNGSLSGKPAGSFDTYKIKQTLQYKAKSDSYGDIIGLFGILGDKAVVKDLNYVLTFANEKYESNLTALYVGAIAGVNKGTIDNVSITINGLNSFESESNGLTFGGVVGSNEGTITNVKVICEGKLKVEETQSSMNVGLVAGKNEGSISCGYTSKEDLNNYVFDIVANLEVISTGNSTVYVGGVAGANAGIISNMIIGGKIILNNGGYLGGFAGHSDGEDSIIDTVVALSLDLSSLGSSTYIGGIAGKTNQTTINYAKFVIAFTEFDSSYEFDENIVSGGIDGAAGSCAGGLVCDSSAYTTISDSSVESFVEKGLGSISATNADGLVLSGGAQITNSFVKAHVNEYYTVKFISNSEVDFSNSLAGVELGNYLISVSKDEIEDWVNVYISEDATISPTTIFEKADKETSDDYYYVFNAAKWENDAKDFVSASWADENDIYGNWQIQQHYNVVSVKGVELFLPYLLRTIPGQTEKEPLMIVEPRNISASINENYVTMHNSDMIPEYKEEYEEKETVYEITESVVVNFFSGYVGEDVEKLNSYKLISAKGENDGLIDVELLPENAQGRYNFKIIEGEKFAYINREGCLVITKASNNQRILIEIYSPFNRDCKEYIAVYSQSLLTELAVKGAEKISDGNYFTNINVGSEKLFVELVGKNNNYPTVFDDLTGVRDYLDIKYTLSGDSKLDVVEKGFANYEIDINDSVNTATLEKNYSETVTFELYIKAEYFYIHDASCLIPNCENEDHIISRVTDDVKIAESILEVGINSAARSVYIESGDREIESQSELDFNVYLETTRYYDDYTKTLFKTVIKDRKIVLEDCAKENNRDSIIIEFIHDTNAEIERVLENTNKSCLAELFNVRVYRELYEENEKSGYLFNVILSLKDEHDFRSLQESFTFELKIAAESAEHVSDSIIVTIKPTEIKNNGISINTYAVKDITFNTEYTNFVSTENATNIIQPAGMGNVMKINISPSYAAVKSIKVESSTISVPGINGEVAISFEQLVYDEEAQKFVTLYSNEITQGNGSLELHRVSMRKKVDGVYEYDFTGEIFVKMNLPKFKGVEKEIIVNVTATKLNGETVEKTKTLITALLPDTSLEYDDSKKIYQVNGAINNVIENSYFIQNGSSNNEIKIKVVGYRFAGLPKIYIGWYDESEEDKINTGADGEGRYATDFLQYHLNTDDYTKAQLDLSDNSYTLSLYINAGAIPAPIIVRSELKLTTIDGVEVSSQDEDQQDDYVVLCPTDYILTDYGVKNLSGGRKNIPINSNGEVELFFNTEATSEDYSDKIFEKFIKDYTEAGQVNLNSIAKLFSYDNEEIVGADTFEDNIKGGAAEDLFEFKIEQQTINGVEKYRLVIEGKSQIRKDVTLTIPYYYKETATAGCYEIAFGRFNTDHGKQAEFELNIYIVNSENEIPIYTAEDIYNSSTGTWNLVDGVYYILMNDIVLENVVPITTAIGQLDGNNRVISIKSFKIDEKATSYGLFEKIGTYNSINTITGQEENKPTILKNVIVDYSALEGGSIPLNTSTAETLTIGGLVGVNDGGLIYNCDVVNVNQSLNKIISVIVPDTAKVVFGGLVGENKGVITNSRVGRESYERIRINNGVTSQVTTNLGGLTFEIYGNAFMGSQAFVSEVAGLVGVNSGTISNSFVTRTNIINYSASEKTNKTAGFVATNNGTILSSYIKADDNNINRDTNRSTGYGVEQKGNGIVAGFVYSNSGTISNSFANVELSTKSAYIAGFVYENLEQGVISESYAAATMNAGKQDNNAEQSFVGVDNAGNLMSEGTIKNSYYLMRNEYDEPYTQQNKNVAYGLNASSFKIAENLTNFAFVLESSSSAEEQRQGIWSYNALSGIGKRVLPELTSANVIAFSYRYEKEVITNGSKEVIFVAPAGYEVGTEFNPYTIASAEEYNRNFAIDNSGYFRLINNISFVEGESGNQAISIATKTNFTLGEENTSKVTSFEGNGLTISKIYLDIDNTIDAQAESVGLFAKISNAYVKNLNLEFATPPAGQFSTTSAIYSGGLAGKISNSAIMNINLLGVSTTLVGQNFVGGLAGLIDGSSLIYGIESNLNVVANKEVDGSLYYNLTDYLACNVGTEADYRNHIAKLSYAGGIAGVIDIEARSGIEFNLNSLTLRGDLMSARTINGSKVANISGEYAGGIAGYAGSGTKALRLNVVMNKDEEIYAKHAVGGLFGVSLATIEASQVSAKEEIQFNYDTEMGRYLLELKIKKEEANINSKNVVLDETKLGNISLLSSDNYVGGLVGLGLGTTLKANYSKASVKYGRIIGGMIGVNVSSNVTYSYAVPFISSPNESDEGTTVKIEKAGGMFGLVLAIKEKPTSAEEAKLSKLKEYSVLIRQIVYGKQYGVNASLESTYSSIIIDESFSVDSSAVLDYVAADYYTVNNNPYLSSSGSAALDYVFAGVYNNDIIQNQTKNTSNSVKIEAADLYNLSDSAQELTFNEIFSGWSIIKYWSLDNSKYLPLLTTKVVDNFIIIDDADDFKIMEANPDLNYKIVDNIRFNVKDSNWVVKCDTPFTGILLGEMASDASRPTITIQGLNPNEENQTSGFINLCSNATINNIEIVWVNQIGKDSSIETGVDLDYVSGFVCEDVDSLISNVVVRGSSADQNKQGSVFSNTTNSITGFGGIVGKGEGTSILGSEFTSSVTVKLRDSNVSFGGIAGTLESTFNPNYSFNPNDDNNSESSTAALISGVKVGAEKRMVGSNVYPETIFNVTVSNSELAHIGGVVGQTNNASIATTTVGHVGAEDPYRNIKINVTLDGSKSVYVGGIGGYLSGGIVTGITDLAIINITGNDNSAATTSKYNVMVGGIAGQYTSIASASGSTTGVKKSTVQTNITTNGLTLNNSELFISTGFGQLNIDVEQSLFDGEVNTQQAANLPVIYSGSVAGKVDGNQIYLQEVISNAILNVGCSKTRELYVGGFIGFANSIEIESSATWGRVVPETSATIENIKIYAGGLLGKANGIIVRNSYSLSSVIMDSLGGSSIAGLTAGALVGKMEKVSSNKFENVYYSSDIALCVEENSIEDKPIGINLSASTILKSSDWSKTMGTFWGTLDNSNVPHVYALEDELKKLKICDKDRNTYTKGTVMNPVLVDNAIGLFEDYTFYLVSAGINLNFNSPLNGVLIGADMLNEDNSYGYKNFVRNVDIARESMGVIPVVNEHSAISNIHLYLGSGETYDFSQKFNGLIAGLNNGVIFNSSVQGDGVNINSTFPDVGVGLIAGKNTGVISYSYSSAEVRGEGIGVTCRVAGITYNNSGKMLSNYFTGYIDSSMFAAGMFMASDSDTDVYLYNNYMGGVITSLESTAFAGVSRFEGSNNYIDKYSDVEFYSKTNTDQEQGAEAGLALISINTANLMSNRIPEIPGAEAGNGDETENAEDKKLLKGSWNITLDYSLGRFLEDENDFFGRNYNYPTYKFNKMSGNRCIDYQKQLITGNGLMVLTGPDKDNQTLGNNGEGEASLTYRYGKLISTKESGESQTDTYTYAYKIPHYGILQSVNALLGKNRNYVLMYDIDAGVTKSAGGKTGVEWFAIGSDSVEGFKSTAAGFNGVFVTNRYFKQLSISDKNNMCTIQGVRGEGLFTNMQDAFIGNLNLGSFYELKNSGALGVNVGTENATNTDNKITVYVDSINVTTQSVISGAGVNKEDGDESSNYYGALFGAIYGESIVNITNFNTTDGESSKLTLSGKQDTVGLIAGKVANGTIQFKQLQEEVPTATQENADTKKLIALFDGNGIAGGLVGEMQEGTINIEGYQVLISKTGDVENQDGVQNGVKENGEDQKYTKSLGGIIGKAFGGQDIVIIEPHVTMFASDDGNVMIYANSFGGFVGSVEGNTSLQLEGSSVLDMKGDGVKFFANINDNGGNSYYYGLLVGSLDGTLEVDSFSLLTEEQKDDDVAAMSQEGSSAKTFSMRVVSGGETSKYEDDKTNFGLGGFVGKQNGSIIIKKYEEPTIINLTADGIPNVGGIAGVYQDGDIAVDLSKIGLSATTEEGAEIAPGEAELDYLFVVSGSTNVGGLFGYAATTDLGDFKTNSADKTEEMKEFSLLNSGKPYSLVIVHGSSEANQKHKNFGGLFGRLEGDGEIENKDSIFVNNNPIIIGSSCGEYKLEGKVVKFEIVGIGGESIVYNVGGIAGSLEVKGAHNFVNNAEIKYLGTENIKEDLITVRDMDENVRQVEVVESIKNIAKIGESSEFVCRAVNVGGVAGHVIFESGTIEDNSLTSMVNTRPIVGYQNVGGIVGYIDSATLDNSDVKFVEDDENDGETNSNKAHTYGTVSGVINVGGAFGYVKLSAIKSVYANSKVFGNTNVGGMAGFVAASSFENCLVGQQQAANDEEKVVAAQEEGSEGEGEEDNIDNEQLVVGGIYYIHNKITNNEEGVESTTYIPTSIGGFIGAMDILSIESTLYPCTISSSKITNVLITSAKEGGSDYKQKTISTNYNNMLEVRVGEGNNDSNKYEDCIKTIPGSQKIHFSEISSGFGGLIGTTASSAISNIDIAMTDVVVNATLGVNVGYLYGAFRVDKGTSMDIDYEITASKRDKNLKVDGSYNVGAVAGLLQSNNDLSEFSLGIFGNQAVIYVESELTGINVGGIFGKTDCNSITGLQITDDMARKIHIATGKSYYIGGLIGVAQITNATANLSNLKIPESSALFAGETEENVGAFIGRLKVLSDNPGSKSAAITVSGEHWQAFTINAIENENYKDGETNYNTVANDGLAELYAEAFYINKDKFTISGSSDIFYENPLRDNAHGWSKEYTAFRKIQRCISADDNNEEWDSTTPYYDAANITHVALVGYDGPIDSKEMTENDKEIYADLYTGKNNNNTPAEIKYTIYRSFEEEERLYCGMGIAKAVYDNSAASTSTYGIPDTDMNTFPEMIGSFFDEELKAQIIYLDCTGKDSVTNNMKKFDYNTQYPMYDKKWYEGNPFDQDHSAQRGENETIHVIYFVDDYLQGAEAGQKGDAKYYDKDQDRYGAFFQFDVLYKNKTINNVKDTKYTSDADYCSPTGSLFDISGIYDDDIYNFLTEDGFPWFKLIVFLINVAIDIALFVWTGSAGNAVKAGARTAKTIKKGAKAAKKAKKALKGAKKLSRLGKVAKTAKSAGKAAKVATAIYRATVLGVTSTILVKLFYMSSAFFGNAKGQPFGLKGTTYSRNIEYEIDANGKIKMKNLNSETQVTKEGESYIFYSTERPVDFASNEYITTMAYTSNDVECVRNESGKVTSLEITLTEYEDDNSNSLDNYLEQELISYDSTNLNHELHQGVKVTYTDTDSTKEELIETIMFDKTDSKYYTLKSKYKYINGKYYIHVYCCDVESVRTTLEFVPETIIDGMSESYKSTPDWISSGGNYYVSGALDSNGRYYYDSYTGNNLSYEDGIYTINQKTFGRTEIEESQQFTYVLDDPSIIKSGQDETTPYTEGYEYFTKVYYTAEVNNAGWSDDVVRPVNFYYCGNSAPEGQEVNVEYVVETIKDEYDNETREYYTIYPNSNAKTIVKNLYPNRLSNPYRLNNPYLAGSDNPKFDCSGLIWDLEDKWFIYKGMSNNLNTTVAINHSPTYYLYEGGYIVDIAGMDKGDEDFVTAVEEGVVAPIYTRVTKAQESSVITIKSGDSQEKYPLVEKGNYKKSLLEELSPDSETDVSSWEIVGSDGTLVTDMYKVVDGVLYVYNGNYTLGEDLLLHRLAITVPQEERKNITQFENLYLSNREYSLYTYYKYYSSSNDKSFNHVWEYSDGGKTQSYYIIPQSPRDTTLNRMPTVFVETCRVMFGYENAKYGDNWTPGDYSGGGIVVT